VSYIKNECDAAVQSKTHFENGGKEEEEKSGMSVTKQFLTLKAVKIN
jgi:hypothetical protein